MLDKAKMNYSRISTVQSFKPKERLEDLEVNKDKVTIAPVDAIDM